MSAFMGRVPFAARSAVKIARARGFELLGLDTYSRPALSGMDREMTSRLPEHGTFLEIGANDGYSQSNTYYLERRRGWQGILIEPLPGLYRICRAHRRASVSVNVACAGPDAPPTLSLVRHDLRSVSRGLITESEEERRVGRRRTVEVPTSTLSDVIGRSGFDHINFMSIDVEGAELHVLAGLDLARHCPDFLLVETAQVEEVARALAPYMRETAVLSGHDYLFERTV